MDYSGTMNSNNYNNTEAAIAGVSPSSAGSGPNPMAMPNLVSSGSTGSNHSINSSGNSGFTAGSGSENEEAASATSQMDYEPSPPIVSESDEQLLQRSLAELGHEIQLHLGEYAAAKEANNVAAASRALGNIERARNEKKKLQELFADLEGTVSDDLLSPKSTGLTLSHRDLPKFQLASSVVRPYPNEEVFES